MSRRLAALCCAAALALAACGGDDDAADDVTDDGTVDDATAEATDDGAVDDATDDGTDDGAVDDAESGTAVVDGEPFPAERCAANEAIGTITYLTSFDFAAAASIIDVVVADERGYYDELCLDVEITPGLSFENYPLVASGTAQFSSGGSFAEVASFAAANDAEFAVVVVEGNVPIDVLMVEDGVADELEDLAGATIGVQGRTPMSIAAMLATAGLSDGEDLTSVPLAGFDAVANIEPDEVVGITGYKSNEVGQLDAAGVAVDLFDPADYDVPGSFGAIYTTADFLAEHPLAVDDFVRATLRGLADALADPTAAAELSIARAEATGNAFFLSLDGETFRWQTEAALVEASAGAGPIGAPDVDALQAELDAYAPFGLFGDAGTPDAGALVAPDVVGRVIDVSVDGAVDVVADAALAGDAVIWPG